MVALPDPGLTIGLLVLLPHPATSKITQNNRAMPAPQKIWLRDRLGPRLRVKFPLMDPPSEHVYLRVALPQARFRAWAKTVVGLLFSKAALLPMSCAG
jgi:hypothetical protein